MKANSVNTNRRLVLVASSIVLVVLIASALFLWQKNRNNTRYDVAPPPLTYSQGLNYPDNLPPPLPIFTRGTIPSRFQQISQDALMPPPADVDQTAAAAAAMSSELPSSAEHQKGDTAASKVGLIVCDPVTAPGTDRMTTDFGIGCGHWLHLIAAGQPEFGRTPPWDDLHRLQRELHRKDLMLNPGDCAQVRQITGATDIACGTIAGSSQNRTLTYQIYALPQATPLGSPFVVRGSLDQVDAGLPAIAKQIDAALGVEHADIPSSTDLTPNELSGLGECTRVRLPTEQLTETVKMSEKCPLAGILLLQTRAAWDQVVIDRALEAMMTEQPRNPIILEEAALAFPDPLRAYAASTRALISRYPGSSLLALTEVFEQQKWGTRLGELAAGYRAVVDSPESPRMWIEPSKTLEAIAVDVRKSRFPNDAAGTGWTNLPPLLTESERVAHHAVELDPLFGEGWTHFGVTASMAADRDTAIGAFGKAENLDLDAWNVDYAELAMFAPKWDNDPGDLDAAAQRVAALPYDSVVDAIKTVDSLQYTSDQLGTPRYRNMSLWLIQRVIKTERARVSKEPDNPLARWSLALILNNANDRNADHESLLNYQIAEHFLPNSAKLFFDASGAAVNDDLVDQAQDLRRAVDLDPYYPNAHYELGDLLSVMDQDDAAISELRVASLIDPRDPNPHFDLGTIYRKENKPALSSGELFKDVQLDPYNAVAWEGLCADLDDMGRYRDSLAAGASALHADKLGVETNKMAAEETNDAIADDEFHLKDWSACLNNAMQALSVDDGDPSAHELLAQAYWQLGRKTEARAEWKRVIALNDPATSQMAAKQLAAHR